VSPKTSPWPRTSRGNISVGLLSSLKCPDGLISKITALGSSVRWPRAVSEYLKMRSMRYSRLRKRTYTVTLSPVERKWVILLIYKSLSSLILGSISKGNLNKSIRADFPAPRPPIRMLRFVFSDICSPSYKPQRTAMPIITGYSISAPFELLNRSSGSKITCRTPI